MNGKTVIRFGGCTFDPASTSTDFDREQDDLQRLIVAFANDTLESCAFYRQRAAGAGITDVGTMEDFFSLPLLGTAESRVVGTLDLLPAGLRKVLETDGPAGLHGDDRIVRVSQSTSSSGHKPKLSLYTASDWAASAEIWGRVLGAMTGHRSFRILNCFHPGHGMGRYIDEIVGSSGCLVVNRNHASTSIDEDVRQISSGLGDLGGFDCLAAPAWSPNARAKGASLDALLTADVDNVIGRQIRFVITAGVPLDGGGAAVRERLAEAAEMAGNPGPEVGEIYGGAEVGICAATCESGFLHVFSGPVFTEVVDPVTGQPAEDGAVGRVAVTSLRRGSRYVRYLIGDQARVTRGQCQCGRWSTRLAEISRVVEPERLQSGCAAGSRG